MVCHIKGRAEKLGISRKAVSHAASRLIASRTRNENTLYARLWRAMRIKERFTTSDLLEIAVNEDDKNPLPAAGRYLRALECSGFITRLPKWKKGTTTTSGGFVRYMLVRNNGHLSPLITKDQTEVFDPNSEQSYPIIKGGKNARMA